MFESGGRCRGRGYFHRHTKTRRGHDRWICPGRGYFHRQTKTRRGHDRWICKASRERSESSFKKENREISKVVLVPKYLTCTNIYMYINIFIWTYTFHFYLFTHVSFYLFEAYFCFQIKKKQHVIPTRSTVIKKPKPISTPLSYNKCPTPHHTIGIKIDWWQLFMNHINSSVLFFTALLRFHRTEPFSFRRRWRFSTKSLCYVFRSPLDTQM